MKRFVLFPWIRITMWNAINARYVYFNDKKIKNPLTIKPAWKNSSIYQKIYICIYSTGCTSCWQSFLKFFWDKKKKSFIHWGRARLDSPSPSAFKLWLLNIVVGHVSHRLDKLLMIYFVPWNTIVGLHEWYWFPNCWFTEFKIPSYCAGL